MSQAGFTCQVLTPSSLLSLSPGTCCSSWAITPSLTGGCHLQTLRSCHDLLKKLWLCLSQGLLPWYQVVLVALPSPISKQRGTPSRRGHAVGRYPGASFSCTDSSGWHYKAVPPSLCLQARSHPTEAGKVQQSFSDKSDLDN